MFCVFRVDCRTESKRCVRYQHNTLTSERDALQAKLQATSKERDATNEKVKQHWLLIRVDSTDLLRIVQRANKRTRRAALETAIGDERTRRANGETDVGERRA